MRVTESAVAMKGSSSYNHYQETTSVVTQMSAASWKELQERQSNDSSRRQSDRRDKDENGNDKLIDLRDSLSVFLDS